MAQLPGSIHMYAWHKVLKKMELEKSCNYRWIYMPSRHVASLFPHLLYSGWLTLPTPIPPPPPCPRKVLIQLLLALTVFGRENRDRVEKKAPPEAADAPTAVAEGGMVGGPEPEARLVRCLLFCLFAHVCAEASSQEKRGSWIVVKPQGTRSRPMTEISRSRCSEEFGIRHHTAT